MSISLRTFIGFRIKGGELRNSEVNLYAYPFGIIFERYSKGKSHFFNSININSAQISGSVSLVIYTF